jgi:CubicO group peptidase (beta-lactamase class C family)
MIAIIDDRTNAAKFRELTALARDAVARFHVPGVAIGLAVGEEDFVAGLGVTSVENPLPVTTETLFQIGSTTKTFTSTAIFRMIEQGKLSLDDRVRKHLPDFKVPDEETAANVTIRHLLNHTAGWLGDYFLHTGVGDDALARFVAQMPEVPIMTPLGEVYTYNNTSFNIAGRILEVVLGKTYEAAIQELVLDPLEMSNTFFFMSDVILRRFVVGHNLKDGVASVARPWDMDRNSNPCGGLVSDAYDQLRYARFHMGDGTIPTGERILTPESLKLMQTPSIGAGSEGWIGLNWFIREIDGVSFVSHGGSTIGQQSEFWMAPEKKLAFTVLTNLDKGNVLYRELTDWVRLHFLGVEKAEEAVFSIPVEKLPEYCAGYVMSPTGDVFTFNVEGNGLVMTHTPGDYSMIMDTPPDPFPPLHADPCGVDTFIINAEPLKEEQCEFLRGKDGKIAWLRFGGRILPRK